MSCPLACPPPDASYEGSVFSRRKDCGSETNFGVHRGEGKFDVKNSCCGPGVQVDERAKFFDHLATIFHEVEQEVKHRLSSGFSHALDLFIQHAEHNKRLEDELLTLRTENTALRGDPASQKLGLFNSTSSRSQSQSPEEDLPAIPGEVAPPASTGEASKDEAVQCKPEAVHFSNADARREAPPSSELDAVVPNPGEVPQPQRQGPRIVRCESKSDECYIALPVWHMRRSISVFRVKTSPSCGPSRSGKRGALTNRNVYIGAEAENLALRDQWNFFVMHPNSLQRGVWDGLSCIFVLYDSVTIPLALLNPADNAFTFAFTWVTRIFWTLDIATSFFTGTVAKDGAVHTNFWCCAWKYLRTWFLFDVCIVALDWFELLLGASEAFKVLRVGRSSRVLRMLRMIRLLRLIRIREVIVLIAERIRSERLIIVMDIAKIVVAMVGFSHVIACFWYGISDQYDTKHKTWVRSWGLADEHLLLRYVISLHWSLSQFSGGMDEVRPQNLGERIYAVATFIVAFLMASLFVSRLTSSMTQLKMLTNTQAQQLVTLRRYLAENKISHGLAVRVQKNAQNAMREQQTFMPESKVELLNVISEALRMDLHFELFEKVFSVHPYFSRYMHEYPHAMHKVCHQATSMYAAAAGEILFDLGETPIHPKMYFVCSGTLSYRMEDATETTAMRAGQWIAEAVLWAEWTHRGQCKAVCDSRLCCLDAKTFQHIVGSFEHRETFDPRAYAMRFVDSLNSQVSEASDIFDVSQLTQVRRYGNMLNTPSEDMLMQLVNTASLLAIHRRGSKNSTDTPDSEEVA
mmetsp:Transcript_72895/g.202238  ORF Transcript_72895/g.202238 Transcript_72895/m.202238 type:complete len:803 (-) Transcript_72895:123-2531(-)